MSSTQLHLFVIKSFRSRALRDLLLEDDARGLRPDLASRVRARLQALQVAKSLDDLKVPGWRLHPLHTQPVRWAIAVDGPWRITFEWDGKDAFRVELEQCHEGERHGA
jgi:proteic killer suppression protein